MMSGKPAALIADWDASVGGRVLATGGQGRALLDDAVDEWKVLTASALVGLAREALHLGVEYTTSRHQFGVPIGSFQAVAHRLADVATMVEGAKLLTQEAAWAADAAKDDRSTVASMALLFAAEVAQCQRRVKTDPFPPVEN